MSLNANIERVSWEPGTGTRYDLLLASYKREDSVWLAADAAGMLAFVRAKGFLVQMPPDFNKYGRWAPKLTAVQA